MTADFLLIPSIAATAAGMLGTEPLFTFPEVSRVIKLCSAHQIAVLGVEIFLAEPKGYRASGCSDYDLRLASVWAGVETQDWEGYVAVNNSMAEDCIRQNRAGDDHVYILTTASLREFRQIRGINTKNAGDR